MSMPRPSGKAKNIAENTIPGLNRNVKRSKKRTRKDVKALNAKNMNVNPGKIYGKRKKNKIL